MAFELLTPEDLDAQAATVEEVAAAINGILPSAPNVDGKRFVDEITVAAHVRKDISDATFDAFCEYARTRGWGVERIGGGGRLRQIAFTPAPKTEEPSE